MATSIGKLVVSLTAVSAPFERAMSSASRHINSFRSATAGVGRALGGMNALFAAAAGGGVAYLIKSQMNAIDATAKLADALGLSTEALVGYQHAADLSGVESTALQAAFTRMAKTISEVAAGGKAGKDAFDLLGLSAQDLLRVNPDQQMQRIADAMMTIKNPTDRARVALELFGRAGVSMLPMLSEGSKGIRAMQADAAKLGLTFSRDAARAVEEANDSLTRFTASLRGAARVAAIEAAPAIRELGDSMTEALATKETRQAISDTTAGFTMMAQGIGKAWKGLNWVGTALGTGAGKIWGEIFDKWNNDLSAPGSLANHLAAWSKGLADLPAPMQQAAQASDRLGRALQTAGGLGDDAFDGIEAGAEGAAGAVSKAADEVERLLATLREQAAMTGLSEQNQAIAKLLKSMEAAGMAPAEQANKLLEAVGLMQQIGAGDAVKHMQEEADAIVESLMTPLERREREITRLGELRDAGMLTKDQYAAGVRAANEELQRSHYLWERTLNSIEAVADPIQRYEMELQKLQAQFDAGLLLPDEMRAALEKAKASLPSMGSLTDMYTVPGVPALEEGTTEAYSFLQAAARYSEGSDRARKTLLTESEKHTKLLQQLVDQGRGGGGGEVVKFEVADF